MTAGLTQLLNPQVLTRVISETAASSDWLANLFGLQPGGANEVNEGHGRNGAFNIYNNVRAIAQGRAPGTAAGKRAPNIVGQVNFTYPRMHDSVALNAEQLHNLGLITNPALRDSMGADMVRRQTKTLGQLAANWRKAQIIGMLRDSLYVVLAGDNQYFALSDPADASTPAIQINFQMPAGNKTKLNMLGGGDIIGATWSTTSTDIPAHLGGINAAFQQLNGGHLGAVLTNWGVWNNVVKNDYVRQFHGTSNPPFTSLQRSDLDPKIANTMKNVFRAVLNIMPDVTWYITDEVLDFAAPGASASLQKIIPANYALFIGFEPGDDVLAMYQGSEPISERDGEPMQLKTGLSSWSVDRSNPTATELYVLDNALAVNHIKDSIAYGQVVF